MRTADHRTKPNGEEREREGIESRISSGSSVEPSSSCTGPIHWVASRKATRRKRQCTTACSIVSCWPSSGHAVPLGCHPASLVPTGSFRHSACWMKVTSSSGSWTLVHSFHVSAVCLGGSGRSCIRYASGISKGGGVPH